MNEALPTELTIGAILRFNEYAWELPAFSEALQRAPSLGYACLGGQLWFLLPDNTVYELFWLEANSSDRAAGEPWSDYASRSCEEVLVQFDTLVRGTNFDQEASEFRSIESSFRLMFNAYFVTERELSDLIGNRKIGSDTRKPHTPVR
jgi:hypothetical protein